MNQFSDISQRALEIRALFEQYETRHCGRPWTREEIALGYVGDVGDLMKLVQAMEGVRGIPNPEEKMAHELSDCLWSLLVLADKYHIDLEQAFLNTMDDLEAHLKKMEQG